jgi:hypothetical protein
MLKELTESAVKTKLQASGSVRFSSAPAVMWFCNLLFSWWRPLEAGTICFLGVFAGSGDHRIAKITAIIDSDVNVIEAFRDTQTGRTAIWTFKVNKNPSAIRPNIKLVIVGSNLD